MPDDIQSPTPATGYSFNWGALAPIALTAAAGFNRQKRSGSANSILPLMLMMQHLPNVWQQGGPTAVKTLPSPVMNAKASPDSLWAGPQDADYMPKPAASQPTYNPTDYTGED